MMKVIRRKDAISAGLKRYFIGKLCKKGHSSPRYVSSGLCVVCVLETSKRWRGDNKERANAASKRWYENNKEKSAEQSRRWFQDNKEKATESSRKSRNKQKLKLAEKDF